VEVDAERLGDDALEIDTPPAHDAVFLAVRANPHFSNRVGASGLRIRQKLFCDNDLRRFGRVSRCGRSVAQKQARLGGWKRSGSLFSYVDLEARVGKDHPRRINRGIVNEALAGLSGEFSALYSRSGRPSIPPEKLLRAMLLQAFYSIRSERQLTDRLEFDLLFRWFVGIGVDDAAWDHSTFSKNRERLLEGDIAAKFLSAVMAQPRVKRLLSTDHFSVDGTLVEAWRR
jgi:transposase